VQSNDALKSFLGVVDKAIEENWISRRRGISQRTRCVPNDFITEAHGKILSPSRAGKPAQANNFEGKSY
jgi:hypothetical protein